MKRKPRLTYAKLMAAYDALQRVIETNELKDGYKVQDLERAKQSLSALASEFSLRPSYERKAQ